MDNTSNFFLKNYSSLEELVDEISEVLHCSVTIEDVNHRLLSYSKHDEKTDAARISTIIGRMVPEKVINSLWKHGIIPALLASEKPIQVNEIEEIGLGNRIAVSIRKGQEVLGYIWIVDQNQNIDDEGLNFLVGASKAAKNLLLKIQASKHKKEEGYQEFFRMLLNDHFDEKQKIISQFHKLGVIPPTSYTVLVIRSKKTNTLPFHKQIIYLLETMQKLKIVFYRMDGEELIVLTEVHETTDIKSYVNSIVDKMKERFHLEHVHIGVSSVREDLLYVGTCWQEAQTVLDLKGVFPKELTHVYGYDQLGLFAHIPIIAPQSKIPLQISLLEQYDRKNNSELLVTLETYLDYDQNINDVAKHMHIHVNTLNYRLKRISEVAHINLKDFNEKASLYLKIKINTFLKKQ